MARNSVPDVTGIPEAGDDGGGAGTKRRQEAGACGAKGGKQLCVA